MVTISLLDGIVFFHITWYVYFACFQSHMFLVTCVMRCVVIVFTVVQRVYFVFYVQSVKLCNISLFFRVFGLFCFVLFLFCFVLLFCFLVLCIDCSVILCYAMRLSGVDSKGVYPDTGRVYVKSFLLKLSP